VAALLAAAVLTSACGTAFASDAAVVSGREISMRRVSDALDLFVGSAQYKKLLAQQEPSAVKRQFEQSYLGAAIRHDVLIPAASRLGVEVTQDELDARLQQIKSGFPSTAAFEKAMTDQGLSIGQLTDLIRDRLLQDKLRTKVVASVAPSNDVLTAYYRRHKTDYTETRASHILVTKRSLAATIADRLHAAPASQVPALFASLAKKYSTDTQSAKNGGDLGYQRPGQFIPQFEDAEAKLSVGEVSDPVHTSFGWHVIMVTGRKAQSFAAVKSDIEQVLAGSTEQNAWEEWLRTTYAAAHVRVNPVYGTFDVISQQVLDSTGEHVPGTGSQSPAPLSPTAPLPSPGSS
jgi:parvulin-like peptidyl-prolyl isomerase